MAGEAAAGGMKRDGASIFVYFAGATILLTLCSPGGTLLDLGTAYLLQIQLHASAMQVSVYRAISGVPLYPALVFGLAFDIWSPVATERDWVRGPLDRRADRLRSRGIPKPGASGYAPDLNRQQ